LQSVFVPGGRSTLCPAAVCAEGFDSDQGVHNVLYVATENDSLYAFDADGLTPNILWHLSFIDPANGVTTINCIGNDTSCNVYPITGITSTPVIDPATSTIYLVVRTLENGSAVQRLQALDIATGAEKLGGPVVIAASVSARVRELRTGRSSSILTTTCSEQRCCY